MQIYWVYIYIIHMSGTFIYIYIKNNNRKSRLAIIGGKPFIDQVRLVVPQLNNA